jgi:hypothetical protein
MHPPPRPEDTKKRRSFNHGSTKNIGRSRRGDSTRIGLRHESRALFGWNAVTSGPLPLTAEYC